MLLWQAPWGRIVAVHDVGDVDDLAYMLRVHGHPMQQLLLFLCEMRSRNREHGFTETLQVLQVRASLGGR